MKPIGLEKPENRDLSKENYDRKNCTSSKLYKQAGNSIVVDILMEIIKVLM